MESLNQIFFREYAALDKLLAQVYGAEKGTAGVTHYLNLMKEYGQRISHPNADFVFKKLRHLRHIRNEMAHEPGAFESADVREDDIDFIRAFSKSVSSCTDPLSPIFGRKRKTAKPDSGDSLPGGCLTAIIVGVVIMVVACILIGVFKIPINP